jgi:hypothetical protein
VRHRCHRVLRNLRFRFQVVQHFQISARLSFMKATL